MKKNVYTKPLLIVLGKIIKDTKGGKGSILDNGGSYHKK